MFMIGVVSNCKVFVLWVLSRFACAHNCLGEFKGTCTRLPLIKSIILDITARPMEFK